MSQEQVNQQDQQASGENQQGVADATQQMQQTQQAPVIDPNAIASAVAQQMESRQQAQQNREKTLEEMSESERAAYLQVFDPAEGDYDQRFIKALQESEDPTHIRQVLGEFRDGVVNQSLRGTELMVKQQVEQIRKEMQPAVSVAQQQSAEKLWGDFSTQYPGLANNRNMVDMVATQLAQQGYRPASQEELFTRVATTTQGILKQAGVEIDPTKANTSQTTQNNMQSRTTPGMVQQHTTQGNPGGGAQTQSNNRIAPFFLKRRG